MCNWNCCWWWGWDVGRLNGPSHAHNPPTLPLWMMCNHWMPSRIIKLKIFWYILLQQVEEAKPSCTAAITQSHYIQHIIISENMYMIEWMNVLYSTYISVITFYIKFISKVKYKWLDESINEWLVYSTEYL